MLIFFFRLNVLSPLQTFAKLNAATQQTLNSMVTSWTILDAPRELGD